MFGIKVEQLELMDALKKVKSTVGKGKDANNPFDKYVYMQVQEDAKCKPILKLTTTNLNEISEVECELISASSIGEVCSLLEFTVLYNLIATIDSSTEVEIVDSEPGKSVTVNYAGRKKPITLAAPKSSNFVYSNPNDKYDTVISLQCGDFKDCIDRASTVIVDNEEYPIYNCVHINIKNGQVIVKAIDVTMSKRMLLFSKMISHKGDGEFFIECNKAKKLIAGMDPTQNRKIGVNNNTISLEQRDVKYFIRLVTGTFPALEQFMPNQYKVEAVINKEEALAALKRVKVMSDSGKGVKTCVFSINNVFTNIDLNTQVGSISEMITTSLKGQPLEMVFSIDSLISTLYSIDDSDVKMCFYANSCTVLMPANTKGIIHRVLVQAMNTRKN